MNNAVTRRSHHAQTLSFLFFRLCLFWKLGYPAVSAVDGLLAYILERGIGFQGGRGRFREA